MFEPIHQHLILKLQTKRPITNENMANQFLVGLVNMLGMVPVTTPQSVYVHEQGNEGLTGSINLATSHIAYHCWDTTGLLMVDVYSCKQFNINDVISFIDHYWEIDKDKDKILFQTFDRADNDLYFKYSKEHYTNAIH